MPAALNGPATFDFSTALPWLQLHRRVVVKIMRRDEFMAKAVEREVTVLKELMAADSLGRSHCVRLFDSFQHKTHACLVRGSPASLTAPEVSCLLILVRRPPFKGHGGIGQRPSRAAATATPRYRFTAAAGPILGETPPSGPARASHHWLCACGCEGS